MQPAPEPLGVPSVERLHRMCATTASAAVLVLMTSGACAQGWILPAGTGVVEPMIRYSFGDQSFPAQPFSFATHPSSNEQETQLRLLGEHGLGDGFSLEYDLRYAFRRRSEVKNGIDVVSTNSGLQEQRIALNYGLTQDTDLADSVGLGLIIPGSPLSERLPLDSGQWAVEPVYGLGFKPGFWNLTARMGVASRIFLDGGAAQFRTQLEVGTPIFDGVHLAGKLFFVRTARMGGFDVLHDRGEIYNLLRVGAEAKFRLTDSIEPVLAYEDGIAGTGGHSEQRLTLGVKLCY